PELGFCLIQLLGVQVLLAEAQMAHRLQMLAGGLRDRRCGGERDQNCCGDEMTHRRPPDCQRARVARYSRIFVCDGSSWSARSNARRAPARSLAQGFATQDAPNAPALSGASAGARSIWLEALRQWPLSVGLGARTRHG